MSGVTDLVPERGIISNYADITIVGNGIAGVTAAIEARRLAPDASIVIISEQSHPTIHTPALKQFALGKVAQEQLLAFPAGTERSQRIHMISARVESINAQEHFLALQGERRFGYRSLLIATGSRANGLPTDLPGRNFDGVLTLHTLNDYLNMRRRLPEVESAVVIGGGAHAIETVMILRQHNIDVQWLIRGEVFLPKTLDRAASEMTLSHIRRMGVKVHTQTSVMGIVGRVGSVIGVVTNLGKMIPCQLVLVCTGTSPNTSLADHCSLPLLKHQGILVDEQFRTNVPGIYAAGDVAACKNPQTGRYATQAQWYAAARQGQIVAAAMTGHYNPVQHATGIPWHATHLGELCLLTVGSPLAPLAGTSVLSDRSKRHYCRMLVSGDRLAGYLWLGPSQPDSLAIKRLIDEQLPLRHIKQELLKGHIDARTYFSAYHERAMQEIITSAKLPAITSAKLPAIPASAGAWAGSTRNIVLPPIRAGQAHTPPGRVSPQITGGYQTEPLRDQRPASRGIYDMPTMHGIPDELLQQPSTGELAVPPEKVVESILVPLPTRSISRGLMSYSQKLPAIKGEATQEAVGKSEKEQAVQPASQAATNRANFLL